MNVIVFICKYMNTYSCLTYVYCVIKVEKVVGNGVRHTAMVTEIGKETKSATKTFPMECLVIANVMTRPKQWRKCAGSGQFQDSRIAIKLAPLYQVIFTDIHY